MNTRLTRAKHSSPNCCRSADLTLLQVGGDVGSAQSSSARASKPASSAAAFPVTRSGVSGACKCDESIVPSRHAGASLGMQLTGMVSDVPQRLLRVSTGEGGGEHNDQSRLEFDSGEGSFRRRADQSRGLADSSRGGRWGDDFVPRLRHIGVARQGGHLPTLR